MSFSNHDHYHVEAWHNKCYHETDSLLLPRLSFNYVSKTRIVQRDVKLQFLKDDTAKNERTWTECAPAHRAVGAALCAWLWPTMKSLWWNHRPFGGGWTLTEWSHQDWWDQLVVCHSDKLQWASLPRSAGPWPWWEATGQSAVVWQ